MILGYVMGAAMVALLIQVLISIGDQQAYDDRSVDRSDEIRKRL